MRRLIPLAAVLLAAGFLIWAFWPRPVEVELADVANRSLEVTVEEEGEARIREVFTLSATTAGKLQRIRLHAGDEVAGGVSVVAEIAPAPPAMLDARAKAQAEAAVAAAQAALDLARAQLAQAEAALEFATTEADRATVLYGKGSISKHLLDSATLARKTALAAVDSAEAAIAMRQRDLESAEAVLAAGKGGVGTCCTSLVAPVSGRILRVLTEGETMVQPGTPILEIGDPGNLEVTVDLLSRDAVRIAPGALATITGWGGSDLPAQVDRVEPSAVTQVSALGIEEQRVKVVLALTGPAADYRALGHGFRVIARIALWRGEDVLTLPIGALFRDGSDWAAYVLRDGRTRLQRITLGERNEDFAQVLKGLAPGDRVILHPSDLVSDGVAVVALAP